MFKRVHNAVVVIALVAAMALFVGCAANGSQQHVSSESEMPSLDTSFGVTYERNTDIPEGELLPLDDAMCVKSAYTRSHGWGDSERPVVVHSVDELREVTGAGEPIGCSQDGTPTLSAPPDTFDEEFFAEKDLLCAFHEVGSGSIDVIIDWAVKTVDGYEVSFAEEKLEPGVLVTCDMAYWTAYIPIEKS